MNSQGDTVMIVALEITDHCIRAIRERTKNQIETLERKIRELTSQQPYQELQHVLRQKEAVEAENVDIKKRLASVLSMIQPVLGQQHIG